ncbi:MAG: exosortase/archaeosortase family protein [Armatimonadetes bacterium]|nr:exosortase/archaeosortase family protein [Armatimonadota bacterium]
MKNFENARRRLQVPSALCSAPRALRSVVLWSSLILVPLGWLYAPVVRWWVVHCLDPDNSYQHAFVVPLISGYLIWRNRSDWRREVGGQTSIGLILVLIGLLTALAGAFLQAFFIRALSVPIVVLGLCWWGLGHRFVRRYWFPMVFLFFAVPLGPVLEPRVTLPLQVLATRLSSASLGLLGVPSHTQGVTLILPHFTLTIEEACSGMRSVVAVCMLTALMAYFSLGSSRTKIAVFLMSPVLALLSNMARIIAVGLFGEAFGAKRGMDFFHNVSGFLLFGVLVGLVMGVAKLFGLTVQSGWETDTAGKPQLPESIHTSSQKQSTISGPIRKVAGGLTSTPTPARNLRTNVRVDANPPVLQTGGEEFAQGRLAPCQAPISSPRHQHLGSLLFVGALLWPTALISSAISAPAHLSVDSLIGTVPDKVLAWKALPEDHIVRKDDGETECAQITRNYARHNRRLQVTIGVSNSWRAHSRYLECAAVRGEMQLLSSTVLACDSTQSGISDLGVLWFQDSRGNVITRANVYLTRGHGTGQLWRAILHHSLGRLTGKPLFMQVTVFDISRGVPSTKRTDDTVAFTEELCGQLLSEPRAWGREHSARGGNRPSRV